MLKLKILTKNLKLKMNLVDGLIKYLENNKMKQFRNNLLFDIN